EHARGRSESMVDYIGRAIRALKRFARLYGVVVIVVAHPTKDVVGRDGKPREPTLYDVEGAAHWYNKADHGIVVKRPNPALNDAEVHLVKVKHIPEAGRPCTMAFVYQESGQFLTPQREPEAAPAAPMKF